MWHVLLETMSTAVLVIPVMLFVAPAQLLATQLAPTAQLETSSYKAPILVWLLVQTMLLTIISMVAPASLVTLDVLLVVGLKASIASPVLQQWKS